MNNRFSSELDNSVLDNSPENRAYSPSSAMAKDSKITSTSSSKLRRGATEKRVVSVPINKLEIQRLKVKGDHHISAPPSDSWAWRKYGQKPIKGSPYPRGYYKCSSWKGCPAKKQVERCRVNPTMLIVTYSCDHNHPSPEYSRNNHHRSAIAAAAASSNITTSISEAELEEEELEEEEDEEEEEEKPINRESIQSHNELISDNKLSNFGERPDVINSGEFGWFTDFDQSAYCTMLESPMLMEDRNYTIDKEMAMIFTVGEEDESDLFADLGELPECSTVFRRGMVQREAEQRRRSLATTG